MWRLLKSGPSQRWDMGVEVRQSGSVSVQAGRFLLFAAERVVGEHKKERCVVGKKRIHQNAARQFYRKPRRAKDKHTDAKRQAVVQQRASGSQERMGGEASR
jgi:hypothetical protein